jgi:hypothetical protein
MSSLLGFYESILTRDAQLESSSRRRARVASSAQVESMAFSTSRRISESRKPWCSARARYSFSSEVPSSSRLEGPSFAYFFDQLRESGEGNGALDVEVDLDLGEKAERLLEIVHDSNASSEDGQTVGSDSTATTRSPPPDLALTPDPVLCCKPPRPEWAWKEVRR